MGCFLHVLAGLWLRICVCGIYLFVSGCHVLSPMMSSRHDRLGPSGPPRTSLGSGSRSGASILLLGEMSFPAVSCRAPGESGGGREGRPSTRLKGIELVKCS